MYKRSILLPGNVAAEDLGLEPVHDDEDTVAGLGGMLVQLFKYDHIRIYDLLLKHMLR